MIKIGTLGLVCALILGCASTLPLQGGAPVDRRTARNTLPQTPFYEISSLPHGEPGQLIRSAEFDDYDLQSDMNATRILYHSRSVSGKDVAVSGVVLVPDKPAPAGGWPLIAWAHAFTGVARQCAPSLKRNLEHGPVLSMWLNLGYAIVATDYAGLGASAAHAGGVGSQADDVINSVLAARSAVPQIGKRWLAMGQGEGAEAVIAAAEKESEQHDTGFLGSLAVSTFSQYNQSPDQVPQASSGEAALLLAFRTASAYADFQPGDILQPKAEPLYKDLQDSCANPAAGLPAEDVLKPGWASNKFVREFLLAEQLGQKSAKAPLLLISGAPPGGASSAAFPSLVRRMCKLGDHIEFDQYQKPNMSGAYGDSVRSQMAWVKDRFEGRPAQANCQ